MEYVNIYTIYRVCEKYAYTILAVLCSSYYNNTVVITLL